MLSSAIVSIQQATRRADRDRALRAADRADLSRAEELGAQLEELLLQDRRTVPAELMDEIRRFVATHERGLVRRLTDAASTLDALFDLEERLQDRRSASGSHDLLQSA